LHNTSRPIAGSLGRFPVLSAQFLITEAVNPETVLQSSLISDRVQTSESFFDLRLVASIKAPEKLPTAVPFIRIYLLNFIRAVLHCSLESIIGERRRYRDDSIKMLINARANRKANRNI
jgi:hypothetical protein